MMTIRVLENAHRNRLKWRCPCLMSRTSAWNFILRLVFSLLIKQSIECKSMMTLRSLSYTIMCSLRSCSAFDRWIRRRAKVEFSVSLSFQALHARHSQRWVFALRVRAVRSWVSPATMSFAQIFYLATRKLSRRTVCAFCLSKHMSCCVLARSLLFRLIIINCEICAPLRLLKRFTFFQHIFYVLAVFWLNSIQTLFTSSWANIRNCLQFCATYRRQRLWESK